MSVLSDSPKLSDLDKWLKKGKLPRTQKNIRRYQKSKDYKAKLKSAAKGLDASFASSEAPWRVVYGQARVPGVLSFIHTGSKKTLLNVVATLAGHEITAVDKIFLDKNEITFNGAGVSTGPAVDDKDYAGKVFKDSTCLGTAAQAVNAALFAAQPTYWTANHRQRNRAYVYMRFTWDAMCFQGMPDMQFLVRGKPVYDPRTLATAYSNNAALVIADFLTDTVIGCGFAWSEIDLTSLAAAANTCDEAVPLRAGGTEARYTINGSFETSEGKQSVLENMCASMGGSVAYTNGSWKFYPGKYRASVGITLTDDDLRGAVTVKTLPGVSQNYNSVRGKYIAPDKDYESTDFPTMSVAAYVTKDQGVKKWEDFDYPFTTSAGMAQRLARIELERTRRSINVTCSWGLKAYPLQVGDTCALTLTRYGWSAKEFEVLDYAFEITTDLEPIIKLELRETDSAAYAWNELVDEQLVSSAPATSLPLPYDVRPPTSITLTSGTTQLYLRGDGTVASRIYVQWTAPDDEFVTNGGRIELEYKRSADSTWLPVLTVAGNQTNAYISDVQDGVAYDVRARSVNGINVPSVYAVTTNHIVIGKTAAPSNVSGFTAGLEQFGIVLRWAAISDLDLAWYEIRQGASWAAGAVVGRVRAVLLTVELLTKGAYTFFIKAIDTTGNYSATEASVVLTIAGPTLPALSSSLVGPECILSWAESLSEFAIADYSVYYGSTFAGATLVVTTKATSYKLRANWSGTRRFWVQARDVKGNTSDPSSLDLTIVAPPMVSTFTAQVVDNNVLLRWAASTGGSLPVDHYKVMRGASLALATLLGNVSGTFAVHFETTAGSYSYWVVPVDSAGNEGDERAVTASVLEPPDFDVRDTLQLTGGSCVNCIEISSGTIVGPCSAAESWDYHFTSNGWNTFTDKADAGSEIYAEPYAAWGRWEKITNHGTTIAGVMIRASFLEEILADTPDTKCCLAYSTDGATWVNEDDVTTVYGSSFNYTRVRFDWGTVPTGGPIGLLLALQNG